MKGSGVLAPTAAAVVMNNQTINNNNNNGSISDGNSIENHQDHETMHMEMLILMVIVVFAAQALLLWWKKHYYSSFQLVSLVGLIIIPMYFSIVLLYYRMIVILSIFCITTIHVTRLASMKPLAPSTPQLVYKWFYYVYIISSTLAMVGALMIVIDLFSLETLIPFVDPTAFTITGLLFGFYGVYFGVLDRDCAAICTERLHSSLGYGSSKTGLSSRRVGAFTCSLCGESCSEDSNSYNNNNGQSTSSTFIRESQQTIRLNCSHLFHSFCIRGWALIGKKQTCPYCGEKVDLKNTFTNPWEVSVIWGDILDWARYVIVWNPIILFLLNISIKFSGLH